ncbi:hypothetical protein [Thermomonospora cellulosilytica]|uniref:Uncharacterized protein n=1 Tax=Thermomonospora cellulosilytica TaxID=1411118 RepID=A0A7W3MVY9_9ACTN|nr:hypothetical protein [Thermomonospora cellulosilytica]MBA9002920.1 hypothetical protein [Thermomonospora cellulosilytica]
MSENALHHLEMVAKVAYYEAAAAAVIIPNAWPMVAIIYCAQANPGQLWDAAEDYYQVKQRLVAADKEITAQLRTLSERDWSGKDRDAFEKVLSDYQNQIRVSYSFALGVHLILKTMALLIAAFIIMMAAFATILALLAAFIIILTILELATRFIPYPPVKAFNLKLKILLRTTKIKAKIVAGKLYMTLKKAERALTKTGDGAAAFLAGGMAVDVLAQMLTGNTQAFPDFAEATVKSADDVIKGRIALLEQKLTAQLMAGKHIGGFGLGKWKLPTANIPKDIRPYISPLPGIKGVGDVMQGTPTFTSPWTKPTEYGDDYVKRTNALPTEPS